MEKEKLWNGNYNRVMITNFSLFFSFYLLTPLLLRLPRPEALFPLQLWHSQYSQQELFIAERDISHNQS